MKRSAILITLSLMFAVGSIAYADLTDDLIAKYYQDILDRSPDPAADTWKAEIERIVSLDIDVKEGFIALARVFFNSEEYTLQNKDHPTYVTDLYQTFLNRTPQQQEVDAWVEYLEQGLSRDVVFNAFVFSDEFRLYMQNIFGSGASLPECDLVNDLYRGLQARLPDTDGFDGWVALMRDAIASNEQAVRDLARRIALGFLQSEEYVIRIRTDRQFLEDLYNGILRRGAGQEEFDAWIENIEGGLTREEVLQEFTNSTEFQLRVQTVIDQLHWELFYGTETNGAFPGQRWKKAVRPEQLGWSSQTLAEARAYSEKIGSAAVMIIDDGVVVDAWGDFENKYLCHSMRKSLMSALIGIHVDEGNIDLSKTLQELGIDDNAPSLTPTEKQATIADLIRARSGIYHPALGESAGMKLLRPQRYSHAPGTFWYYNNWDFNALGTIFWKQTGKDIFDEFDNRFAQPLQMQDFLVSDCRYEIGLESFHFYYNFRMSARDLARFGLLFLREGRWGDHQIVSSDWVAESTSSHSQIWPDGGYGYMWWTGVENGLFLNVRVKEHSFYASGYRGHYVIVLPYRNLVVVHRVDTDLPEGEVSDHQIGRLLRLILAAAGETDIGEDPSIEAAQGVLLTTDGLNELFAGGRTFVGSSAGIIPYDDGNSLVVSCRQNGTLTLSVDQKLNLTGTWWIRANKWYIQLFGEEGHSDVVKDDSTIKLFDDTGTMVGRYEVSQD